MKKKTMLVIGACLLVLTGCGKHTTKLQDGKEVVASIDGFSVTAEDVYAELKDQYGISIVINKIDEAIADKEITDEKDAKKFAENQIESIKAQYKQYGMDFNEAMESAGYKDEEALKKAIMADHKKELVLTNYLKDELSKDEINEYYEDEIFGEMTVKHILIKPAVTDTMSDTEKKDAENAALEKAKKLIKELDDGADFEKLAKENSDDAGTASQGGLFANFTKQGVVPEFFNASLELKDNEYTKEPVKTTYGYHIILKVSQNERPKLDDVIDDIKETLVTTKLKENANLSITAWDEIRNKYKISINDSAIKDAYDKVINQYKK